MSDSTAKKSCFIIMPFGGWFDNYHKEIFVPGIEDAGLKAVRADDLYRPGNIVNDIWNYTKQADIVLADLTGKNPNVFYELGLAHAITKPAVLVTSNMEDVPFDLRSLRVLEYDKNLPNWGELLRKKITKAISETLENPEYAIPPTFLEVGKPSKIKVSEEAKEILQLKRDVESIRREVRSRPTRNRKRTGIYINSIEAEESIRSMLDEGLSDLEIRKDLQGGGAPEDWIDGAIERIKEERA